MKVVYNQPLGHTPTMLMNLTVTLMEKINGDWTCEDITFPVKNVAFGSHGFTTMLPDGDIFGVQFDDYIVQACAW